jgi:FtsH-binding integral membrane protein
MRANTVDVSSRAVGARRRRRNPVVGKIAFGLAIVCLAMDASAFAVFMGGEMSFATGMCFVVVFLTFIAAVLGFIAAVGGLGRWYGVLGVVFAFVGNPVILVIVLAVVAPEAAAQLGATPGS